MANDNITRKLRTLQDAAHMKGLRNLNSNYYICGGYIRELIDDLAEAIVSEPSVEFETGIDPYGPAAFPITAVVVNGKRFIAEDEAKETTFRCPVCGSDNTYGESFEYGLDDCHQPCGCYECDATWDEVYEFAYKTNIKKGDER